MWLMSRLPVPVARGIVSFALQVSFVLWPKKRRYVNDNFAHVLGKPAGSLEVKRKALAAYRSYARYVVELMRLPRMTDEEAAALVDTCRRAPEALKAATRA
jgi:lauroyl/myristoyl acyltransferase